jgi:hypothetical protein
VGGRPLFRGQSHYRGLASSTIPIETPESRRKPDSKATEAYEVLSHEEKARHLANTVAGLSGAPMPGMAAGSDSPTLSGPSCGFGDVWDGRTRPEALDRGSDLRVVVR